MTMGRLIAGMVLWAMAVTGVAAPAAAKDAPGGGAATEFHGDRDAAIANYRAVLGIPEAGDAMRKEAMRRLADLLADRAEARRLGDEPPNTAAADADLHAAIHWYTERLAAYPRDAMNDQVLYADAAAYARLGDHLGTLAALGRLVRDYPDSRHAEEAQFRRGEILFALHRYADAGRAYAAVVSGGGASPYYERALYQHGWCAYKQGAYQTALVSFFALLDRRLKPEGGKAFADVASLGRGEQEVVNDVLRAIALSFSKLGDTAAVARYFSDNGARPYEAAVYRRVAAVYEKQERFKDAADTYALFVRHHPDHPEAPGDFARVIDIYRHAGFRSLAFSAKRDFVRLYKTHWSGAGTQPGARTSRLDRQYLRELARTYHARAQKRGDAGDFDAAVKWYRELLGEFPHDAGAVQARFALAETLYDAKRYHEAALAYQASAYDDPAHVKAADAGYAAVMAFTRWVDSLPAGNAGRAGAGQHIVIAGLRFADAFPADDRVPAVLARTAQRLYRAGEPLRAAATAGRVVRDYPRAGAKQRRVAMTVLAHSEFDLGEFDRARRHYRQVLALLPAAAPERKPITARLAAALFKHADRLYGAGRIAAAVDAYLRVPALGGDAPYRDQAQFDAATGLIALQQWPRAISQLQAFLDRFPDHRLRADVIKKLAFAYEHNGQLADAAAQYEAIAAGDDDPATRREAQLRAARMYEQAGAMQRAIAAYRGYTTLFKQPTEEVAETVYHLAALYARAGDVKRQRHWLKRVIAVDAHTARRTDRTRYLAAHAALTLARFAYDDFAGVRLARPLKKHLKRKKARMEAALDLYGKAADYGDAEVTTAATYRMGLMYSDLSRALLDSERPKGLSDDVLEQYQVLLEEQAYPFEEKAIGIFEANMRRTVDGVYNQWIEKSLAQLRRLLPVRYAKAEKSVEYINAIN